MTRRALFVSLLAFAAVVAVIAFARPMPTVSAADGPEYISQKGCKKCHFKQHRSWKKTVHAKALDILKPGERAEAKTKAGQDPNKDYSTDPACLKCHVTGYGEPGGYPAYKEGWSEDEQKLAKNNAGVGCEACHGKGSLYSPYKKDNEEYKQADIVKLGLILPVSAANCTGCHNKDNPNAGDDYVFDFEAGKNNVDAVHEHLPLKFDHADD